MRRLITCPVCKLDQHIYNDRICIHTGDTILTCSGSKMPIKEALAIDPKAITGELNFPH